MKISRESQTSLAEVPWSWAILLAITGALSLIGCDRAPRAASPADAEIKRPLPHGVARDDAGQKILRLPILSAGPESMDAAVGSTPADGRCIAQVYETLLQYKYFQRPYELEPLLLTGLPTVSADGKTYRCQLKRGIYFHANACFANGTGREVTTDDVFYSWKRLADPQVGQASSSNNWKLLKQTIVGLDTERERAEQTGQFNYAADIAGFQKINDHEFTITLVSPTPRFLWTLAMFQMSIVPREAVEKYGTQFAVHPVGTGPFTLQESDWNRQSSMIVNRNPNYHEQFLPLEHSPGNENLLNTSAAAKKLPLVDRIETLFYQTTQPMWLDFRSRKLGFTTVPATSLEEAFDQKTKSLNPSYLNEGITHQRLPLLDWIAIGFNMEDPLVGGYSEEKRNLRSALALAVDWNDLSARFYHGECEIYGGPLPPGLALQPTKAVPPFGTSEERLKQAKSLLKRAGYPDGQGLPPIDYHLSSQYPGPQMAELTAEQFSTLGVTLRLQLADFSEYMQQVDNRKAQLFYFSWLSDYPDPENNLALFYGPNASPGQNHFNYQNTDFDRLYEQLATLSAGPLRTEVLTKMLALIDADRPFIGSMARVRQYLINPELKNFKATEQFHNWYKYLDLATEDAN